MVLVRMVFQARWGSVQDVVEEFKQSLTLMREITGSKTRFRVLTDLSGSFNTVVEEIEVESLAEWERHRAAIFADPRFQQRMANLGPVFESGGTEFYTIELDSRGA